LKQVVHAPILLCDHIGAEMVAQLASVRNDIAAEWLALGVSEKLHNMLDEFEYLLLGFAAFGHLRCQPPVAGRTQPFKSLADCRIGIKVSGDHAKSSVVPIRSRLVIAENGIGKTLD
jgi:hypothetical protein